MSGVQRHVNEWATTVRLRVHTAILFVDRPTNDLNKLAFKILSNSFSFAFMCDARSMSITSIRRHSRSEYTLTMTTATTTATTTRHHKGHANKRYSSCFKSFTMAFGV